MLIRIWDLHRVKRLTVKRIVMGQKGTIRITPWMIFYGMLKQH